MCRSHEDYNLWKEGNTKWATLASHTLVGMKSHVHLGSKTQPRHEGFIWSRILIGDLHLSGIWLWFGVKIS